jgi:hypothetical protein
MSAIVLDIIAGDCPNFAAGTIAAMVAEQNVPVPRSQAASTMACSSATTHQLCRRVEFDGFPSRLLLQKSAAIRRWDNIEAE